MPSTKNPKSLVNPGPGKLLYGEAISVVAGGGGGGDVTAHILNPSDAHMAGAIGIPESYNGTPLLARAGGPIDGESVLDFIVMAKDLFVVRPNVVGMSTLAINSGVPNWSSALTVGGSGNLAIHGGFTLGSNAILTKYLTPNTGIGTKTVSGIVFPADRGVLALYNTTGNDFTDGAHTTLIAALWLGSGTNPHPSGIPSANFIEANRRTLQSNYAPAGSGYDLVALTYRYPYLNSYSSAPYDSGCGYSEYDSNFYSYQIARYSIPFPIVGGSNGSYLLVHWKESYATSLTVIQPAGLVAGILVPENCYSVTASDAVNYGNVTREFVFADTASGTSPTVMSTTAEPSGNVTLGYLSGIAYYTSTGLQLNATSVANGVFDNSFLTNNTITGPVASGYQSTYPVAQTSASQFSGGTTDFPLFVTSPTVAHIVNNADDQAFTTTNPPAIGAVAKFTHTTLPTIIVPSAPNPIPKPNYPTATLTVNWRGAFSGVVQGTTNTQFLVNPAASDATWTSKVRDSFVAETYRYASNYGAGSASATIIPVGEDVDFDSTLALGSTDLQVLSGRLVYPQTNFTASSYRPAQALRNYAFSDGATTKRRWVRAFNTSLSTTTGKIQLTGLPYSSFQVTSTTIDPNEIADHGGGAIVQIKLPGLSGWLDLGREDINGDKTVDYTGCSLEVIQTGSGSSAVTTVRYSTGSLATAPNAEGDFLIFVRVTFIKGTGGTLALQDIQWLAAT